VALVVKPSRVDLPLRPLRNSQIALLTHLISLKFRLLITDLKIKIVSPVYSTVTFAVKPSCVDLPSTALN